MERNRLLILLALLLGIALRLAFALGYWVDKPLTIDEQDYLTLARNLASGQGFVYGDGREHFGRPPGYPIFLAAVLSLGGGLWSVKIAQCIVGALGILATSALARRAAGERAGVVAALIAAIYPPLAWIPAYVLSETLFSALILATALLLWSVLDGRRTKPSRALVVGALGGISALVRPAALPFLALAAAFLAWRRGLDCAAALCAGVVLVIAPWTAWKSHDAGRFVLIAAEGGVMFWTGNNPLARGEGDMGANPAIKEADRAIRMAHPGLGPEELEPIYYREGFTFVREHPWRWLELLCRKFFYVWVPIGPSYTLHSPLYLLTTWVSYLGLLPFAVLGWRTLARRAPRPAPLGLLGASVVFVALIFSPQERFRIPVLDPLIIIGASTFLARHARAAAGPEAAQGV